MFANAGEDMAVSSDSANEDSDNDLRADNIRSSSLSSNVRDRFFDSTLVVASIGENIRKLREKSVKFGSGLTSRENTSHKFSIDSILGRLKTGGVDDGESSHSRVEELDYHGNDSNGSSTKSRVCGGEGKRDTLRLYFFA